MVKPSFVAVDLFCGVGGLTHGLIKSGIPVRAGVDFDESCRYAYEENNKAKFIHKNIKELRGEDLNRLYRDKETKILVGCAPCQPFSKHTQKEKKKEAKENWGLLYRFLELIKEAKPIIVSMENVPQLTRYQIFSDFVDGLKAEKFYVNWQKVYCPSYGIPQKRTRLVLLASKLGEITLIAPTHSQQQFKTVKMAIGCLDHIGAGEISEKDKLHKAAALSDTNLKRIRKSVPGGSWRDWDKSLRTDCHKKESGSTYSSVYARMKWDKPSPTITTQFFSYGTGRFGHPEQNRALSIREGAILQTFPRKYKFVPSDLDVELKKLGRHIGNAVPVRLGVIIGKSIKKHLEQYGKQR